MCTVGSANNARSVEVSASVSKDCASAFFSCIVTTELDDTTCKGRVMDFMTGRLHKHKYEVKYNALTTDGTTSMLTQKQLESLL